MPLENVSRHTELGAEDRFKLWKRCSIYGCLDEVQAAFTRDSGVIIEEILKMRKAVYPCILLEFVGSLNSSD